MAEFPDPPDVQQIVESSEEDRFGRIIAIVIVLITLAAATTAWLQAGAGRDDDEAAVRAERLASQTLGTISREKALAELRIQRERLASERARRVTSLQRRRAYGVTDPDEARALERGWKDAVRATERATERIAREEGIAELSPELSAEGDPNYPFTYLAASAREGDRLSALRDAANREGDRAEEQVGSYGVALAMFAVSVFLFGYSLTPYGRRNRKLFAVAGSVMSLIALVWVIATAADGPDRPPEEAADAYADGVTAFNTGARDEAIAAFDRTLELWPEYAQAYTLRGLARARGLSAQFSELPRIAGEDELLAARGDLERAIELDPEDIDALLGLAATELLLGIDGERSALVSSARAAQEAIERDPVQPGARYLLAAALLGLGSEPGAAFSEATARTATTDDGERPRDEGARRDLVGGALTSIDAIAEGGAAGAEAARAAKSQVVAESWPEVGPPQADVEPAAPPEVGERGLGEIFGEVELDVGPSGYEVGWPASEPGTAEGEGEGSFDAGRDRLDLFLYARSGGRWVVVPEISGPVRRNELFFDPSSDAAFVRRDRLEVTVPPRCLPAGEYRAEIYVNGDLTGSVEGENAFATDGVERFDDLAVLACRPEGWERGGGSAAIEGIRAPDREAGLLLTRVPQAAAPGRGRAGTREALDAALELIGPRIPGKIESSERTSGPFVDATTAPTELINTSDGGAIAAAARLSQGGIVVALFYGPPSSFRTDPDSGSGEAFEIFRSVTDRF